MEGAGLAKWVKERRGERQGTGVYVEKLFVCLYAVYMLFICVHPYVCTCMHEHADSSPWSNAHSQMKSSNVSARKPQLGSHGS